jgi:site-specific DNA-methyltransferase (adenine-specific)
VKETRTEIEPREKVSRIGVHFSSQTEEWATPRWLFDFLSHEFEFQVDVAASKENALCGEFYTKTEDGLSKDWGEKCVWMNPPYGRAIDRWVRKAYESAQDGATVVALLPARCDTRWWHQYVMKAEIRFLRGRLKFGSAKNSAPFPSAIVIFRPARFAIRLCVPSGDG